MEFDEVQQPCLEVADDFSFITALLESVFASIVLILPQNEVKSNI